MSIYTPRGLRIQLGRDYCFGLLNRLGPAADAARVFHTAEAIHAIPWAFAFAGGFSFLVTGATPLAVAGAVVAAAAVGFLLVSAGIHRVSGVIPLGSVYRTLAWFGVPLGITLVVGPLVAGWRPAVAWIVGWVFARLTLRALDGLEARRLAGTMGLPLRGADRSLVYAYRLHARRLGKPEDLWLSEDEYEPDRWAPVFEGFARRYPEAVRKST